MGEENSWMVKSQPSLEESERAGPRLVAELPKTQYASGKFQARECEVSHPWVELRRRKDESEKARFDLTHEITHRVGLEGDKSHGPRQGQSHVRKPPDPEESISNERSPRKKNK